jgi:hypothetical protein
MVFCQICKNEIEIEKIDKTYQISLGNIINKKFLGKETYYFHIDCLNDNLSHNKLKAIMLIQ